MDSRFLIAVWAVVAWIVYRFVDRWITTRKQATLAEQMGCKECPTRPNKSIFGVDFVQKALKADAENLFPPYMQELGASMNFRTFKHHILGGTGFSTSDPKNIQALLATQFKDFGLGPRRQAMFKPLLGVGIFTADGKVWEHSRAMMRPQFNRDQVSDLDLEEAHVQHLMRALPAGSNGWTSAVDLQTLFFRLTLDSACEFLFGESVDSQVAGLPENQGVAHGKDSAINELNFATAFDNGQRWMARRARFQDFFWVVDGPAARRDAKVTHEFVEYFVRKALAHKKGEKDIEQSGKPKYVFLDALAESTQDPIELRDQLLNILLAGRDTTASLLGWTFWCLARHPEIFEKLRAAIIESFGPYTADTHAITYVSLKNCQYLQHVMAETLRLYPTVAGNFRQALKDTSLPKGGGPDGESPIFIPKGASIDYSVYVMHRREDLWGTDAHVFKPERWVGRKPGWEYLPFNGGPRICLGQQFALTEAAYVITRLLQRFDGFENLDSDATATFNYTLTACPAKGVQVKLHEAKAS